MSGMKDRAILAQEFPPFQRGTPTSRAGAAAVAPKAETQAGKILAHLRSNLNGLTMKEIATDLDLPINAVCGRFNMLRKKRLVRETGRTRMNKGSEVFAVVWEAIDA